MGRICPILNHPLRDGVLVDDDTIVKFIHKSNVDFLPNELVCKSCKQEIIKLYNKKRKSARELYKTYLRDGSVSSLKTSSASSINGESEPIDGMKQGTDIPTKALSSIAALEQQLIGINNIITSINNTPKQPTIVSSNHSVIQKSNRDQNPNILTPNEPSAVVVSVSDTAIVLSTSISNTHSILQENGEIHNNNKISPGIKHQRKRTLRDFLTPMPAMVPINQAATTAQSYLNTNKSPKQIISHQTDSSDKNDDNRRCSQEPSTSKAANAKKRPITLIIDSDNEDEQRLSINAVNGTRLPHIQPIPPKRKPRSKKSLAQDIMDDYIKDITGG